uniref:Uncharacterized protein n=1 Tax=Dendroctonus ponderosae TaxID=77166 RepID=A0AAR5PYG1_DENPD
MFSTHNLLIFYAILLTRDMVYCAENHAFFVGEKPGNRTCVAHQSEEFDSGVLQEFRKSSSQTNDDILTRLIPMLATPFLIQTTFLPMMLLGIKLMLIQSIVLGKFAIIFWLVNLLTSRLKDQHGQFYSHNVHIRHGS